MRNQGFLAAGLLVVALAGLAGVAQAGTHPQDHNGWSIGIGLGGGSAGLSIDGAPSSGTESGSLGSFRLGYPLNEKVSLAMESNLWTKSEAGATVTFNAVTAGVAFFPSEGLALRGGIGLGGTTVTVTSPFGTFSSTESGLGLNGSVGYEFRLGRTFAIGPQLEAGYATFSGGSSNWVGGSLALNWYFVKK